MDVATFFVAVPPALVPGMGPTDFIQASNSKKDLSSRATAKVKEEKGGVKLKNM
jgi:hypothetical protein